MYRQHVANISNALLIQLRGVNISNTFKTLATRFKYLQRVANISNASLVLATRCQHLKRAAFYNI